MKHRKLRIAWSVAWGMLCMLLIVLWVRSYTYWDELYTPLCLKAFSSPNWNGRIIVIECNPGRVVASYTEGTGDWDWHISDKISDHYLVHAFDNLVGRQTDKPPNEFMGLAAYMEYGLYPTICAPIWFLIFVGTVLGLSPWIKYSRRFSLRTLLIATTLVAVGLGLIVWSARG